MTWTIFSAYLLSIYLFQLSVSSNVLPKFIVIYITIEV